MPGPRPRPRAPTPRAPLTRAGQAGVPPGRARHHPGPEDGRAPRQLGQRLRVAARHGGRGPEVDAGRRREPVETGQAAQEAAARRAHGPPQDVADAVRGAERQLRAQAAQRGRLEAGRALQRVREQRRLHLGHVVQRGQRRAAQHERARPVSVHGRRRRRPGRPFGPGRPCAARAGRRGSGARAGGRAPTAPEGGARGAAGRAAGGRRGGGGSGPVGAAPRGPGALITAGPRRGARADWPAAPGPGHWPAPRPARPRGPRTP